MTIIHVFVVPNLLMMAILSQGLDDSVDHHVSLQVQRRQAARLRKNTESPCSIYNSLSDGLGYKVRCDQLTSQMKDLCCNWWGFEYQVQQQKELCNLDLSDHTKFISHNMFMTHDIARKTKHNTKIDDLLNSKDLKALKDKHMIFNVVQSNRQKYWTCIRFKNLKACCDTLKQQKKEDFTHSFLLRQRKLLQLGTESIHNSGFIAEESSVLWIEEESERNDSQRNSTFNGLSYKQWRELIAALQRNMSRDHIWAMLCIVCLIVVMMFAMKVCGLKPMNRNHDRHLDYVFRESDHHTVSIREILALKRPYLPKNIVRLSKRWRWKRKKRSVRFQERDAMADNSEEERLIYSAPLMDF